MEKVKTLRSRQNAETENVAQSKYDVSRKLNQNGSVRMESRHEISVKVNSDNTSEHCVVTVYDAWRVIVEAVKCLGGDEVKVKLPSKGSYYVHIQNEERLLVEQISVV